MNKTISREQIMAKLQSDESMAIVEALPEEYFNSGHLPQAINIPHDQIEYQAAHKLPDKGQLIVVYCANSACANSSQASEKLRKLGYQNVFEYVEGKEHWKAAQLPIES